MTEYWDEGARSLQCPRSGYSANKMAAQISHFADRRALANIERLFGLRQVQWHRNDEQNMLARPEEWRHLLEHNPMVFKLRDEVKQQRMA